MKSHTKTQQRLLAFLGNPESYPHRPPNVHLIQTHASFVFVVAPFVYKVKKAVNFGFLDFSTLDKRRHFCEREVELNRRLAPDVYEGVRAISLTDGKLTFDPGGRIVEYAVQMRLLSRRDFLDERLRRSAVSRRDLERIARVLTRFYQSQTPSREIQKWGRIDRLRISTDENFAQTRKYIGRTISRPAFGAIRTFTERFYAAGRALFESRLSEHRIRDCHGDLHLEHIHLTPRSVSIYDCIEFNDRLRYLDVASDVAFLAMDLDDHGWPGLAHCFVREMAARLDDPGMLRLMAFYKCYRAYVRGKVESLRSSAPEATPTDRAQAEDAARRYFRHALAYTVAGSGPVVLIVMGRVASGKSSLADALGNELGWPVLSSDRVRKELFGIPATRRADGDSREQLYSIKATAQTYVSLLRDAAAAVRRRQSVIVDATFSRREQRTAFRQRIESHHGQCRFIEVTASEAVRRGRLKARGERNDEVSDARLEDMKQIDATYEAPSEAELSPGSLVCVRSRGTSRERIVSETLEQLMKAGLPGVRRV